MPSAPTSFGCCDRCTTSGAARLSGTTHLTGTAHLTDAAHLSVPDCAAPPVPVEAASGQARPRVAASGQAGSQTRHPAAAATSGSMSPAMAARRRLLKAAVFRRDPDPSGPVWRHPGQATTELPPNPELTGLAAAHLAAAVSDYEPASADREPADRADFADSAELPRTVWGTVIDVSPHVLVVGDAEYEQRFSLTPDAVAWRGWQLEPAALRHGDNVVFRLRPGHRAVADRIWANIGRVTGVILERSDDALLVDEGATRVPQLVVLPLQAMGRIQVRFPTLEPGFLVDIIGRRQGDELVGLIPATSQPSYPAARLPAAPLVNVRMPGVITGSATWHEPRDEPPGVLGVAYPALDPETGCAEDAETGLRQGYARMPYLAIGSVLRVRNDCTGTDCLVPITACAPIARLFNDRCVTCGTSPRGRIADLTMASFIALGGELERGCFNAALSIGE